MQISLNLMGTVSDEFILHTHDLLSVVFSSSSVERSSVRVQFKAGAQNQRTCRVADFTVIGLAVQSYEENKKGRKYKNKM